MTGNTTPKRLLTIGFFAALITLVASWIHATPSPQSDRVLQIRERYAKAISLALVHLGTSQEAHALLPIRTALQGLAEPGDLARFDNQYWAETMKAILKRDRDDIKRYSRSKRSEQVVKQYKFLEKMLNNKQAGFVVGVQYVNALLNVSKAIEEELLLPAGDLQRSFEDMLNAEGVTEIHRSAHRVRLDAWQQLQWEQAQQRAAERRAAWGALLGAAVAVAGATAQQQQQQPLPTSTAETAEGFDGGNSHTFDQTCRLHRVMFINRSSFVLHLYLDGVEVGTVGSQWVGGVRQDVFEVPQVKAGYHTLAVRTGTSWSKPFNIVLDCANTPNFSWEIYNYHLPK